MTKPEGNGVEERACSAAPFAASAEPPLPLPTRRSASPGAMVLARAGIVAAAGLGLASTLAGYDAPALHAAGPVVLVAHADARTRTPPRMHPLADRVVAMRERGTQSRTFALEWAREPRERDAPLSMAALSGGTRGQALAFTTRTQARHFRVLAAATVLDGRTLGDGAFRIRLRDVALPGEQDMCVMLNGETQPCATRLATQLELMVRWRQVVCQYEPATGAGEVDTFVGACRIGNTDIASRLAEIAKRARRTDRTANAETSAAL